MPDGELNAFCERFGHMDDADDVVFYPEYGHEELKGADDIIFEFLSTL